MGLFASMPFTSKASSKQQAPFAADSVLLGLEYNTVQSPLHTNTLSILCAPQQLQCRTGFVSSSSEGALYPDLQVTFVKPDPL
jgi:hypothetical protein